MSLLPGEIAPPEDPTLLKIYNETGGVMAGRRFAVMRDGAYAGYGGRILTVTKDEVTWSWASGERGTEREPVDVFAAERVAWWTGS